jgi:hypothetical protein|tara:strand:+ start:1704 stop:1976 length:273 start_codon:yes stop_codon:yes gene_type:complete
MPKSSKQELETKAAYNKKPSVQKKRVAQNKARREAIADGRAAKGDGKDVHHVDPLDKGGSTSKSNTKVVSKKENRGWRKKNPEMYTKGSK